MTGTVVIWEIWNDINSITVIKGITDKDVKAFNGIMECREKYCTLFMYKLQFLDQVVNGMEYYSFLLL